MLGAQLQFNNNPYNPISLETKADVRLFGES
jgi:hypothetical protein